MTYSDLRSGEVDTAPEVQINMALIKKGKVVPVRN
jgi:hypothetical protein